jgi:uncharacterized protein (DUF2236 family)
MMKNGRLTSNPSRRAADDMTWRLHAEMALLAGWGRAILLQLAHPLIAEGVAAHSGFLAEGWGRLRRLSRTLSAMLTLTFGTEDEAAAVVRGINGIHDRVHGELPVASGVFPARTRYTAHDPALLAWVHASLIDSQLLTYERFVAPLSAADRDRYCEETSEIEGLVGIPHGQLPRSARELAAYMDAVLSGDQLCVTETARTLGYQIVNPPAFVIGWPIIALARLPTIGFLPPSIRAGYGFPWSERRARALGALTSISRRLLPLVPPPLRYWPMARAARARQRRRAPRA